MGSCRETRSSVLRALPEETSANVEDRLSVGLIVQSGASGPAVGRRLLPWNDWLVEEAIGLPRPRQTSP